MSASSPSWDRARELAHRAGEPLAPRRTALSRALGCVLAEDLLARCDLPAADTSAMDGWAVRGEPPWRLVGRALAGTPTRSQVVLGESEAVVIATGATLPAGATGIVRSERGEETRQNGQNGTERYLTLCSGAPSPPDLSDLRRRGREASAGERLLAAGQLVRPTTAGLAAAAGHDRLLVHPRPRVCLLVLGDELLLRGRARDGAVRDALGVQLPAWVESLGGRPGRVARVPDTVPATLAALGAANCDVVVTTGGSARGHADHLRSALAGIGARLVVDTVDVRPGHPMLLAALPDGRWLVGLPGNPLAALAGLLTLLAPLLAGLRGAPLPPLGSARVEDDVAFLPRGRHPRGLLLVPVARTPAGTLRVSGYAASSMLRGVALADGFVLVPSAGLGAGDRAGVLWWPWTGA